MIEFCDITKTYAMGQNTFQALKGISFKIDEGEMVAIVGPSGSGKSTTMNIIGLLDHQTSGQYLLNGDVVQRMGANQLACLRNQYIGFIFQSFFLLPRLTALQNVSLPLMYRNIPAGHRHQRSMEMLKKVEMGEFADHKPTELSGGQQQRVAIARALVGEPSVILADEPTGALDSVTSQHVLELLISINKNEKATVIVITHDHEVAEQCPRVIQISDGLIKA